MTSAYAATACDISRQRLLSSAEPPRACYSRNAMANEIMVIGRAALPRRGWLARLKPFVLGLESDEGGMVVYENDSPAIRAWVRGSVAGIGFTPKCIVNVRKACDDALSAAYELARAVDGVVTDELSRRIRYDAHGEAAVAQSHDELVTRVTTAFRDTRPYLAKLRDEARANGARVHDGEVLAWHEAGVVRLEAARRELAPWLPGFEYACAEITCKYYGNRTIYGRSGHGPAVVALESFGDVDDCFASVEIGPHDGAYRGQPLDTRGDWADLDGAPQEGRVGWVRVVGGFLAEVSADGIAPAQATLFERVARAAADDVLRAAIDASPR